jgi:hypothetical protein
MRHPIRPRRLLAVLVVGFALLLFLFAPAPGGAQPARPSGGPLERLRERARFMSSFNELQDLALQAEGGQATAATAQPGVLRWLEVKNTLSRFATAGGSTGASPSRANVGIGADPAKDENEPTVVANPHDEKILVAGSHSADAMALNCVAYFSRDKGSTWSVPIAMAQLTPESFCSDPVLAYAPDGRRVYYAYMDIKFSESIVGDPQDPDLVTLTSDLDIVVSHSDNGGRRWSGPVVALDGDPWSVTFDPETGEEVAFEPGFDFDKPWIATHVAAKGQSKQLRRRVYVSATRFDSFNPGFACAIAVTSSADRAESWRAPVELESSGGDCGAPVLVQGPRPSAGPGDQVVVAWFNSGSDGPFQGQFKIRTAFSSNGTHWRRPATAVRDSFEAPSFLGPFAFYHRWFGTMFPDIEIAPDGRAHLVYTHDPEENGFTFVDPVTGEEIFVPDVSTTAEDGDIRYIRSPGKPFSSWSAPVTLNDDGLVRAQGYPALETSQRGGKTVLHVLWEDHRRSPEGPTDPDRFGESSNLYYDIFATSYLPGRGWFRNRRVTDKRSIVDFIFIGDYFDITTSGGRLVFGIWTDRRHQTSIGASLDENGEIVIDEAALEDNVFGARLRR